MKHGRLYGIGAFLTGGVALGDTMMDNCLEDYSLITPIITQGAVLAVECVIMHTKTHE